MNGLVTVAKGWVVGGRAGGRVAHHVHGNKSAFCINAISFMLAELKVKLFFVRSLSHSS